MSNRFFEMSNPASWALLVRAVTKAAEEQGYHLVRMPGRGRSNVWQVERNGKSQRACIRTTRNRWIAFPPLSGGTKWKTLDDVGLVFAAAVDEREDPRNIEVYEFPADEVRGCFDAAHEARTAASLKVRDDFGMWVNLDTDPRGIPASVGSGLADKHKPIATYPLASLMGNVVVPEEADPDDTGASCQKVMPAAAPATIAEVLAGTRNRIAEMAGVPPEAVKLDLKIEY